MKISLIGQKDIKNPVLKTLYLITAWPIVIMIGAAWALYFILCYTVVLLLSLIAVIIQGIIGFIDGIDYDDIKRRLSNEIEEVRSMWYNYKSRLNNKGE